MKPELIGTKVRLIYPLQAITVSAKDQQDSVLYVPIRSSLVITEVANEITGLLVADWDGKRILLFEKDLKTALGGAAIYQSPPDPSGE